MSTEQPTPKRTDLAQALRDIADRIAAFDGDLPTLAYLRFHFMNGSTTETVPAAVAAVDALGAALLDATGTTGKTGTLWEHAVEKTIGGLDVAVLTFVAPPAGEDPAALRARIADLESQLEAHDSPCEGGERK